MFVKIINVSSFHGEYVDSIKVYFTSIATQKEGGIELSGFITDTYPYLQDLRNGEIIDLEIKIEKKGVV